MPLDHHPHIVKRRRRHHAGNDERLWEGPGPIWTRQRSRPAVGAFAAGRVLLLLLLYLRRRKPMRRERYWLVFRLEFVAALLPRTVLDRVQIIRIRVWLARGS